MSPADGGALSLREITVLRGGRAVAREVSIEIAAGEVTALLGPNGAGKSSLVLAVGGVLKPLGGSVLLDGRELARRRPEKIRQAGIAIVPEGRRLLSDLTVEENIRVATYALPRDQAQGGRARALELFPELEKRLRAPARSLSGGEQQMLVLAQALVSEPRFVIIDELSLGLAPVVVQRLIPTISAMAQSGIGVLLIEQFATVALGLANRAYVMEGGPLRAHRAAARLPCPRGEPGAGGPRPAGGLWPGRPHRVQRQRLQRADRTAADQRDTRGSQHRSGWRTPPAVH